MKTINLIVPRGWHELDKFDSVYMGEFDREEDFTVLSSATLGLAAMKEACENRDLETLDGNLESVIASL